MDARNGTLTRRDEAHYVIYRALNLQGLPHSEAYATATQVLEDLTEAGLTVTKRSGRQGGTPK